MTGKEFVLKELSRSAEIKVAKIHRKPHKFLPRERYYPFVNNFHFGNFISPVILVTPRECETIKQIALDAGVAFAISIDLRPERTSGLECWMGKELRSVVLNVLSNPNIRYIIVAGDKQFGEYVLRSLGIIHSQSDYKKIGLLCGELSKRDIDQFRAQVVDIIDFSSLYDKNPMQLYLSRLKSVIKLCYQQPHAAKELLMGENRHILYDPGRYKAPVDSILVRSNTKSNFNSVTEYGEDDLLSIGKMTSPHLVDCDNATEAWNKIKLAVESFGRFNLDDLGRSVKEVLGVTLIVRHPMKKLILQGLASILGDSRFENERFARTFLEAHFEASFLKKTSAQVYFDESIGTWKVKSKENQLLRSFGPRVRAYRGFDQLEIALRSLKKAIRNGRNSRRIGMNLVDPLQDFGGNVKLKAPPELTEVYLIPRKGRSNVWEIHGVFFVRSLATEFFPVAMYCCARLLEYTAQKCSDPGKNIKPGILYMLIASAHTYETCNLRNKSETGECT